MRYLLVTILAAGCASAQPGPCAGSRDLHLTNGKIVTLDRQNTVVSDLIIQDGKFTAVGKNGDTRTSPCTRNINLGGRTVVPGLIDTPLLEHRVAKQKGRLTLDALRDEAKHRVPLGRRGEGWDVAYAALFLTSREAKYVSGTEILVDGGLLAKGA